MCWLAFNERVLQEAEDDTVPILERIKFLGIYSNNQDEFFRVRMATLRRATLSKNTKLKYNGQDPKKLLDRVQNRVLELKDRFDKAWTNIQIQLESQNIFVLNETNLSPEQSAYVSKFFLEKVRPRLIPTMLDDDVPFPSLDDRSIYLAVRLVKVEEEGHKLKRYALIKIPTDVLSRFVILPEKDGKKHLILLDDIIRHQLNDIFHIFDFDYTQAYTIKVTREALLSMDQEVSKSLLEVIEKSLKQRGKGEPTRFVFDRNMPKGFRKFLKEKLNLKTFDTIIEGARYHNFKDFIGFPSLNRKDLAYPPFPPLRHPFLKRENSFIRTVLEKDILVSVPYQPFYHLLDLLREAAIDPYVTKIKMTFYRVARDSSVVNAIMAAAWNGKEVTAVIEPMARFDEQSNINLTSKLSESGVKVVYGVKGVKVHAKLIYIERVIGGKKQRITCVSTGNFNEASAKVFSDFLLFTSDKGIAKEVNKLFKIFIDKFSVTNFKRLLVSPFNSEKKILKLIKKEIKNHAKGLPSGITIKTNHINHSKLLQKLLEAADSGVPVKLLIRTTCALYKEMYQHPNIFAIGIVDMFLEHSRVLRFTNAGDTLIYLGSADLLSRNFEDRVEVLCPVYNKDIQATIDKILEFQLEDNVKTRRWTPELDNPYIENTNTIPKRSQWATYNYFYENMNKYKTGEEEEDANYQEDTDFVEASLDEDLI